VSAPRNLRDILETQKSILVELERETNAILNSDLTVENEALKKEAQQLRESLMQNSEKLKAAKVQNHELKNALYEQVYSERLQILSKALNKSNVYFQSRTQGEVNRLALLERDLANKTSAVTDQFKKFRADTADELNEKFSELVKQANAALSEAKERLASETGAFTQYSAEQFEKLKDEQITDEMVAAIGKKNNLEAFVGGNLINKLGILFVILGIIAVSQFTFFQLPNTFRGLVMFAVSGLFLLAGEFFSRKQANIFSLGVTSAGVAGLYASLSISYFYLGIIGMYPAILLCILITAGAFVLSQRYDSQTIASFALVGGYIPIISISESITLVYSAMVYFIVLNLLALSISFYKKWKISMCLGFFLNLIGTSVVVWMMFDFAPGIYNIGISGLDISHISTIVYVFFAFAIYTFIPLLSCWRTKKLFGRVDIVVLALNTFFSAILMYIVFNVFGLDNLNGVMALAFAIIYITLGRLVEKRVSEEKRASALFYLTGLTFVVLVVPMQFGSEWLSLGWLVQGVALAAYGILTDERNFKRAGIIIGMLCFYSFVYFDIILEIDYLFSYKYLAITLGSMLILACLAYKKNLLRLPEIIYKYAVLVNVWFYGMYLVSLLEWPLYHALRESGLDVLYNDSFLFGALIVTVTFAYAIILPYIPIISDKGTKIMAVVFSCLGMFLLLAVNATTRLMVTYTSVPAEYPVIHMALATLVLVALCALAVFVMRNVMMFMVLEAKVPVEALPFCISAYFIVILTQNLITQYRLEVTSTVISIIYVVAAFAWISFGFVRRFAFIRRFGLGLSILAVAKLFLVDLPDLTQGYRIISYFAFGLTLLGISFVYQYFSKRLLPLASVKGIDSDVHAVRSVEADYVEENVTKEGITEEDITEGDIADEGITEEDITEKDNAEGGITEEDITEKDNTEEDISKED
jgi:uncharacterized membrane protein